MKKNHTNILKMHQILFVVVIVVNIHWRIFFTLTFREIRREGWRKEGGT